ncbi:MULTISPECIES: acetyl-CoA hydrolase/transferase family protein [unclassified Modicisalibacter]|uniref:acetyl-CoA hydrolase/transferase family protein n=1 Tax=unclassified Modicisalibacter TaxID=2679913 RepID=UPI001CCCDE45|nr:MULTISPECIES: acetyl-CoA hydrolase/transferase family protein [unclassified Modicisalibacter]MBZ9556615.1 acetyl-CoA hydrolase/transferase family protein [Modicisalibacter sp. R2A 31.J]MBZ9574916.1 acetyl-CoA hydrolase/transferase family protein [Modicisalibacter sp. MOD 31.J]
MTVTSIGARCRLPGWESLERSAEQAAALIENGMTVGMSGFTRAGEAKAVPRALADRAQRDPLSITLMTGASLGNDLDKLLTEAHVLTRRMPFQVDATLRRAINAGEVMFIDQHLSETVELLRNHQLHDLDVAVVEAAAITEEGGIVPTTSVGNSASYAILAKRVIIELNLSAPAELEGLHDIYIPQMRPNRTPIPVVAPDSRIGTPYIPIDPAKIAAIVVTDGRDSPSTVLPPDADTQRIADHLTAFFTAEVEAGRLTRSLLPLQAGIGSMANAVVTGLAHGPFEHLTMYSEVLQDSTFELFDAGKLDYASGCSITLSEARGDSVWGNLAKYRDRLILRPQELSNHPGIVRRLGVIAINTALEADIYGNVNSTHVCGTRMMNGIGGSGDFARNAQLSVFITKSLAKDGDVSSLVPFVSHVDHTEHDVDILVTEHGLADLRGLAPRERAPLIIEHCADPAYRPALRRYFETALRRGGQTPHCLEQALGWHVAMERDGHMRSLRDD